MRDSGISWIVAERAKTGVVYQQLDFDSLPDRKSQDFGRCFRPHKVRGEHFDLDSVLRGEISR